MERIKTILEEILETKIDQDLTEETSLRNDLGFDSLKLAQLTVMIEDEYDIDIFEDGNVETIGEILIKVEPNAANS